MEAPGKSFAARVTIVLIMLLAIGYLIYIGSSIIIPFALSALIAILLMPICVFLEKRRVPKMISSFIAVAVATIFIGGILYFLSAQIASFLNDSEAIEKGLNQHLLNLQKWIRTTFGLSFKEQTEMINKMQSVGQAGLGSTMSSLSDMLFTLSLLPICIFLFLFYREMLKRFIIDVFSNTPKAKVAEVIRESRGVIQNYMQGLIIEMIIVAIINAVGFLILGIKYPIFLAVFAAILNLLPYVGMLIASIFCALITLTTSPDIKEAILVVVVLIIVQFFDNNIIMPKVVGSKVKLNALLTIVAVLVGGALAGVAGMFLSIPGLAILKIIFDRVEELKPWGMLFGDETDTKGSRKSKPKKVATN